MNELRFPRHCLPRRVMEGWETSLTFTAHPKGLRFPVRAQLMIIRNQTASLYRFSCCLPEDERVRDRHDRAQLQS